jgi:hypothetical protein
MRGALPKGTLAASSRSGSEEPGAEDAPELSDEGAGAGAARVEGEAALGLTRIRTIRSPLLVARSQPPAGLLKLTFNVHHNGG